MPISSSTRPNPDQLLEHVQREETRQKRGKLKIFLGYAAGVGKTFAMLEAAQQLLGEGADIVAAYIETHKRADTEALLAGLEQLPRQEIAYRGVAIPEMDLDAVLARHPQIALVDELAHTNAPGSRHDKRYQDIQELLEAGISVHTTLNIQHLESLNDVVAQITGVVVRETVPDWVLEEADEIELIDLPPAELRQRLDEGKVYVPDQAARAIQKFFRPGNLTALREMALRRTADRVDAQMRAYMQTHAIPGPWPAGERLLVCVGPNPLSERLIRTARRLADRLNAEWFAVYVELPEAAHLSDTEHDRITRALRLAEELGGRSLTLPGNSVAEAVLAYAHANNITKIVAGKPIHTGWAAMVRRSIVDQIIHHSGHIDVYVISAEPGDDEKKTEFTLPSPLLQHRWKRLLQSTFLIAGVTLLGMPLRGIIEPTNLVMLYLIAVVMAAVWWGRSPAIWASILGVACFDLIFIPPYYLFAVSDAEYLLTFLAFLGTGFVTGNLASRVREQARTAQRREAQTAAQYELSRALANAAEISQIAEATVTHTEKLLVGQVALFLHEAGGLRLLAASPGLQITEHEQAVAAWAYERSQPAGQGTDTLTGAAGLYLPLHSAQGLGVLGVFPDNRLIIPEQQRLLESFANQTALALERVRFAEKARQAQLLEETEKLQTALLNSISHDLRTPLATITGALSTMREEAPLLDEPARQDLLATAAEEADRLNRLVGNLLDMTRLESGALRLSRKPGDVQDALGVALAHLQQRLRHRMVNLFIPPDLPLVPMDFVLVVQVLVNLLDNADKYSPPEKPITVRAKMFAKEVQVEVADEGPGIPEAEQVRIFDKFYRVRQPDGAGGTGLGLSISKGIVEAHGGRIWAQNRAGGGALFTFALPLTVPVAEVAK